MPHKVWQVGEEVLAADFNAYVQNQVVVPFPDLATLNTAWPSPPDGAVAILTNTGRLILRKAGVWRALTTPLVARAATGSINPVNPSGQSIASAVGLAIEVPTLATVSTAFTLNALDALGSTWTFRIEASGAVAVNPSGYAALAAVANAAVDVTMSHVIEVPAAGAVTVSVVATRTGGSGTARTFTQTNGINVNY